MSELKPFYNATLNSIQRQFGYTNVSDLMLKKAGTWDKYLGVFAENLVSDILNIDTCVSSALDNWWGALFKISRSFINSEGELLTLSDKYFREILKIRIFGTCWDGQIGTLNTFLKTIFADRGLAYVVDGQNMSAQIFVHNFKLSPEEEYLFRNQDIIPRPAGIQTVVESTVEGKFFALATYDDSYIDPISAPFGLYEGGAQEGRTADYERPKQ